MKKKSLFQRSVTTILLLLFLITTVIAQEKRTTISFLETNVTAYEAGFKPAFLVLKRTSNKGQLVINYQLKTTARKGKDFVELPEKIVFENGQQQTIISIKPLTDYSFNRKNKILEFILVAGDGYQTGKEASAIVTIIQDPSLKNLPDDSAFFSKLNYAVPQLSAIQSAVIKRDYATARKILADYSRSRSAPLYPYNRRRPNRAVIDNVLQNTYHVTGLTYNFGKGKLPSIDWSYSVEGNPNWSWEINRFEWWGDLAQAYIDNPKEGAVYAERVFYELNDWLKSSPIDVTIVNQLTPGNRWRHLETGIRLEGTWTQAFFLLKNSPLLSDSLLIDWVKGFYLHGRFLEINAELFTNRGFTDADGLFVCGVFFPEFLEAEGWKQLAVSRMENVMKKDVNADGTLREFSPGYHNVTVGVVGKFIDFANLNKLPLSPVVNKSYENLLSYYVFASEPAGTIPLMNDSYSFKVSRQLADGYLAFPDRKDFQYFATYGEKGMAPTSTSHLFADAGQAVMRSGWKNNDNYLLMDAGPLGISHGHEDKLSINVDGYGVRHIIDCGPYNYEDTNPYRIYSISTHGKSAVLIDDLNQNRRAVKPLYDKKSPITWFSSDSYDYASASYGLDSLEAWGKNLLRPAITTRHIFYLKPDVWVVIDAFKPLDDKIHTYSGLFQCSDDTVQVDNNTKRVLIQLNPGEFDPLNRVITNKVQPSLTITPLLSTNPSLSVVKGQNEPTISGWQFEKSTAWKKQAIPTVRYDVAVAGNTAMAYVLAASPADQAAKKPTVATVQTNAGTYGVKLITGNMQEEKILLIALDGNTISWKNKIYQSPAVIITKESGIEKIIQMSNVQ